MPTRVSVIIPAFNTADFIGTALNSVLRQTEESSQIVVCDDCSTDLTLEIVQKYARNDNRILVLQNRENRGPSYSRNRAIDQAAGTWLAILDSDDFYETGRLKTLIDIAEAHQFDLIADNINQIDSSGRLEEAEVFEFPKGQSPIEISVEEFLINDMSGRSSRNWGFLKPIIRRKFILDRGIQYDETTNIGEDFVFYVECLLKRARFGLIREALYFYRNVEGSLSRTGLPSNLVRLYENNQKLIRLAQEENRRKSIVLLEKRNRMCRNEIVCTEAIRKIRDGQTIDGVRTLIAHPGSWPFGVRKGLRRLQGDKGR